MATKIEMPKLSDTMEEGVIAKWNVKEGDTVQAGDIIAEVETDKATMDVEVFDGGTILKIFAKTGDSIPLGKPIAIIGEPGEDISALSGDDSAGVEKKKDMPGKDETPAEKKEPKKTLEPALDDSNSGAKNSDGQDDRIKASPLARKMAEEKGVSLSSIKGSGPDGRIVKKDIEEYQPAASTAQNVSISTFAVAEPEDVRISQMRKTIAKRLSESKFSNPHFYETIDIDMKAAIAARNAVNEANKNVKISFNDIVVKACAIALRKHAAVNSSWLGDVIRKHGEVNVAVAVAVEDGLMTPVIRNTDLKGLAQISEETKQLAGLARERKLQPEQMEGSTFTISNLGMYGIEEFTAIINPPNACILAVGAIRDVPVVENDNIVPGKRMKVTLSSDHRVVDGASAAQFLNTLKNMIENPLFMLL